MNWIYTFENRIYTTVKTRTVKSIGKQYPNLTFTMDEAPSDPTNHFPTVLFHYLPTNEKGQDLDGDGVHAIQSTLQIDVATNKEQGQNSARLVMWEVVEQLKKLKYQLFQSPEVINTGNETYRVVARMRRIVGASDIVG